MGDPLLSGGLGEGGLGSVGSQYFLAVGVDGDLREVSAVLDEVSRVNDGISVVLFPLLQVFAVLDSGVHGGDFPLMLMMGKAFVLISFDFVFEETLHLVVAYCLIVKSGLVVL